MTVPTITIREMSVMTLEAPDALHVGKEFYTLGEPLVADARLYRKLYNRQSRKLEKNKIAELNRRAEPEYKARAITTTQKFRQENPDYVRAYKRDYDSKDYHRPFCIIDSEGCTSRTEKPIVIDGVSYPAHDSFLWAARYWQRTRPGTGIGPGESDLHHSGPDGKDGSYNVLERRDKTNIPTREILHWLTELPKEFPSVNFASFAFGYDVAQIMKGLPRELRKRICRNEYEAADGEVYEVSPDEYKYFFNPGGGKDPDFAGYGIAYLKGKFFACCKIRWNADDCTYKQFDTTSKTPFMGDSQPSRWSTINASRPETPSVVKYGMQFADVSGAKPGC
jgi:hypothetical protein